MLRIIIADDHAVSRLGLKKILLDDYLTAHIEEVPDANKLIEKVTKENWDLVITDITIAGISVLDVLQQIKIHSPKLPVLVLSGSPGEQYAIRTLRTGASGYIDKNAASQELTIAVRRVLQGKKYVSAAIAGKLLLEAGRNLKKELHELLSDREFEVFKLIAAGRQVTEIALQMVLSVNTISTFRTRILLKMNFTTNAELTIYAMQHDFI